MIDYKKYWLDNGLTVLTHEAWDTPLATVNILYNVGSRDENPQRTGFAHLFEHLMFGGTPQVPDFDMVVSGVGGENNAFTNTDYTNYYITLPAESLRVALFLEADRMAHLDISQKALEVQQHVVTEEYHQRYMNQPYGDAWLLLRPLCYKVHPYRWATIGADIRHVKEASLDDVRSFHKCYYRPDNAILAVAAPMTHAEMQSAIEDAFGSRRDVKVHHSKSFIRTYTSEPRQTSPRHLEVVRDVPASMVYLAWPMCGHNHPHYRTCDLITDLLGSGKSSRLYRRLVLEEKLFTEADACISGEENPGIILVSGKVQEGVNPDVAAEALRKEVGRLSEQKVEDYELQKVINRYENTFVFSQYKAADRALGLCYYTWLGDTSLVNSDPDHYRQITPSLLQQVAAEVFRQEAETSLHYLKK